MTTEMDKLAGSSARAWGQTIVHLIILLAVVLAIDRLFDTHTSFGVVVAIVALFEATRTKIDLRARPSGAGDVEGEG